MTRSTRSKPVIMPVGYIVAEWHLTWRSHLFVDRYVVLFASYFTLLYFTLFQEPYLDTFQCTLICRSKSWIMGTNTGSVDIVQCTIRVTSILLMSNNMLNTLYWDMVQCICTFCENVRVFVSVCDTNLFFFFFLFQLRLPNFHCKLSFFLPQFVNVLRLYFSHTYFPIH